MRMINHLSRLGLTVSDCTRAEQSANQLLEKPWSGPIQFDLLRQGCELPTLVSDTARYVKSLTGPINPNL